MAAVPFMAFADINITEGYDADGIVPISDSTEELISSAVPIDLLPGGNLTVHRVILNTFLTSGEKIVPQRLESESTTTLDVVTSDYGQLQTLLAEMVRIPQLPSLCQDRLTLLTSMLFGNAPPQEIYRFLTSVILN